jgi:hypothetical protein
VRPFTEIIMFKTALCLLALASLLPLSHAFAASPSEAELQAQARITRDQATTTALARVPHAKVRSAELEREHGKLVWSFDLERAGKSGVIEIQVDAISGRIVSQKSESAAQEAAEIRKEAQEK